MKAQAYGGHVSDVTLYTPSQTVLRASPYFFALICHVGDVPAVRCTPYRKFKF